MGCDIRFYVERRDGDSWVSADKWSPNRYADEEGEPAFSIEYSDRIYTGRNYHLFAILADVRNGVGFAGIPTGSGFSPISSPKGLPDDVSITVREDADRWGEDGHSHSWLTVAELLAYDWTQTTTVSGWVDGPNFEEWDRYRREFGNAPPREYCGRVSGGRVRHVSEDEMRVQIQKIADEAGSCFAPRDVVEKRLGNTYCQFEMPQPYYKCAEEFLSETLPQLWRLGSPEDVRIVFWFDN